jgi:hypothetical protein
MILSCPQYGKDDFKKSCDRTNYLKRKFKYKKLNPIHRSTHVSPPRPKSSTPIDNTRENDQRKEKPKVINKTPDPETRPGLSTQAHKEGQVKNPPHMNRNQPLFVRNDGKYFITDEDAQK